MKYHYLSSDQRIHCIKATSFPDGILEAHQKLHALVPYSNERGYFGISHPLENGQILYRAGMSELFFDELEPHQLDVFLMKRGRYVYIDIGEFMKNTNSIGQAFTHLIQNEEIDPHGACIEWYLDNDICRCMVRLKNENV